MVRTTPRRLQHVLQDPPAEYFAPMGEIILRFTRLEYQLGALIRQAVQLTKNQQSEIFFSQRAGRLSELLSIACAMMENRKKATALLEIGQAFKDATSRRDAFVHSVYGHWTDKPDQPMRFRLKKSQEHLMSADKMDVSQLEEFAAEMRELTAKAQAVMLLLKGR